MFTSLRNARQYDIYKCLLDEPNNSVMHCGGMTYGIDWNTGLSWSHASNQGCPVYKDSFQADFHKVEVTDLKLLDKQKQYGIIDTI